MNYISVSVAYKQMRGIKIFELSHKTVQMIKNDVYVSLTMTMREYFLIRNEKARHSDRQFS